MILREQKSGVIFFSNSSNGLSIVRGFGDRQIPLQLKMINHSDMAAARQLYKDLQKKYSQDIGEDQLRMFGQLLHDANRLEEAVRIFKLNLEAYPSSSRCFVDLAGVYHSMGNVTSAMSYCKKALELEPDNMSAQFLYKSL